MFSRRRVRMTRQAMAPRLAMRTFENIRMVSREGYEGGEGSEEGFAFGAIGDAGDAVLQVGLVEIDEESDLKRDQAQVIPRDLFEKVRNLRNGLQLDENKIVYDEIGAKADFFEEFTIVENGNWFLTIHQM